MQLSANRVLQYSFRYVSTEDTGITETWLWTSVPIYLIQPPSVFQFTSLLFSHHHISNRTRDLTVHLPPACYNISAPSCHDSSNNMTFLNNQYLDVLTNQVSLRHLTYSYSYCSLLLQYSRVYSAWCVVVVERLKHS